MPVSPQEQATSRFAQLWESEGLKLSNGEITPANMKDGATDPVDFCVSTIARLILQPSGEETIANIRRTLSELFSAADTQFIYPDESLHISLVGCTPRESSPDVFHQDHIEKIKHICKLAIEKHGSVDIILKGVGIIGNQIFIQGIPLDRGWEETRTDVTSDLEKAGEAPISYPDKSPIHMNIIRITDPSDKKLRLLHSLIEQLREVDLGIVKFITVELVITDFVVSKDHLTTLSEIKLNDTHE